MRANQWRFVALSLLTPVLIAAGIATAADEGSQTTEPQAAPEAATVAQSDQTAQPDAVEATEAHPDVAAANAEESGSAWPQFVLPPAPPPSLQTLVDERRDQLRERREALFDAFRPDHMYWSPRTAHYDRTMDLYRDATRDLHRRQRDYARQYFDGWMDALCPWSKPQRDWTRMRSFLMQQAQLDRQEMRDAWLASRPYAYTGLPPW
jgi:hypothetical protein